VCAWTAQGEHLAQHTAFFRDEPGGLSEETDPGVCTSGRDHVTLRVVSFRVVVVLTVVGLLVSLAVALSLAFGQTAFDWRRLHRPLHAPRVGAGAPCPVSPGRLAPGYGRKTGQTFNGRGPAYLIGNGNVPAGVIDISESVADAKGWLGQKTPWAARASYRGPVLIRGLRIDQPGDIRFAIGYGQHLRELHWPAGADAGNGGTFRSTPATTLFRSAGCYAFQADGASFSTVVVMRVIAG
jgi:hypothetical protein